MASKRMFSKEIVQSSRFLRIPPTCQLLYFHLGMSADDDGYCEWYPVIQMTQAKDADLEILAKAGLVHVFDVEVLVIKDWKVNNLIRSDRYTPSKYLAKYGSGEPLQLGIPLDNQTQPQVRLGKVRLDKKDIAAKKAAEGPFSLREEIGKLEESSRRELNVIALYLDERKPGIESRDQLSVAIKRHLRAAGQLKVFSDDQIIGAIPKAKEITAGWTIETLVKVLTK